MSSDDLPPTYFPSKNGEECWNAKLTESDVILIISFSKAGYSLAYLAQRFSNVSRKQIGAILRNKAWTHINRDSILPYVNKWEP